MQSAIAADRRDAPERLAFQVLDLVLGEHARRGWQLAGAAFLPRRERRADRHRLLLEALAEHYLRLAHFAVLAALADFAPLAQPQRRSARNGDDGGADGPEPRRAGLSVAVWNRTSEKAEPLTADGVRVAAAAEEAAAGVDLLVTMLADGPAIEAVLVGADDPLAVLADDAIWVQMSTVGPAATSRLAGLAADRGVTFVDAPVLGSYDLAVEGELIVLASGHADSSASAASLVASASGKLSGKSRAADPARLKVFNATRDQYIRGEELGHGASDWAAVVCAAVGERAS